MSTTFESSVRHLEVAGNKVEYHEAGHGPTLLMMHGGGPGANAWDNNFRVVDALAETFHVVLLNLPGFGGSDSYDMQPDQYHDEFNAEAIERFMAETGIEKASVYGASGSGSAAVRLAIDFPERVDKLILKGPGGLPHLFTPGTPIGLTALFNFMKAPTRENMVAVMRMFVPNEDPEFEQLVDDRLKAAARREMRPVPARDRPLGPQLSLITQPTLVLWGHRDNMVPFDGALTALSAIKDVQIHLWGNGVGHFVEWERPNEVVRLLKGFLTNSDR